MSNFSKNQIFSLKYPYSKICLFGGFLLKIFVFLDLKVLGLGPKDLGKSLPPIQALICMYNTLYIYACIQIWFHHNHHHDNQHQKGLRTRVQVDPGFLAKKDNVSWIASSLRKKSFAAPSAPQDFFLQKYPQNAKKCHFWAFR